MASTLKNAAYLGLAGLLLIGIAGVASIAEHWDGDNSALCEVAGESAQGKDLEILRVGANPQAQTPRLRLNRRLCIIVANVGAPDEIAANNVALAAQHAAIATLTRDPAGSNAAQLAERQASLAKLKTERDALTAPVSLALFIDDQRVPVTIPAKGAAEAQAITFKLKPTADAGSDDAMAWRDLLGGLSSGGSRTVQIGVGAADSARPAAKWTVKGHAARLEIFTPWIAWIAAGGFALLLAAIITAGRASSLLRDGDAKSTYSLGRVQMAFWLVVTLAGFVFIWVVTGQYQNVVNAGVFTLIGISGATGLAAAAIDQGGAPKPTRNFLADILSDDGGDPQIHRIQVVLWTLVLGSVFVWNVVNSLILTDFDTNLLLLIGVANGIYAGFKTQEDKPQEDKPQTP